MKKNILRVVKMISFYTFLGILLQSLAVNLIFASNTLFSQKLQTVIISLSGESVTLEEILNDIEDKTKFKFSYSNKDIPLQEKISIDSKDRSVFEILEELSSEFQLVFNRINDQITIKRDLTRNDYRVVKNQDDGSIRGKVIDAKTGKPLIGANIIIIGETLGAATDINGNYTIPNVSVGKVSVRASYIGYKEVVEENVEVSAGVTTELDFILEETLFESDELVVIGYGTVKKSDLTGSVSALKSDDFSKGVSSSVDNLLQGKTPGVIVNQSSGGEPGGGINIRVRGSNSINADNKPLYVVDGFPISNNTGVPGDLSGFVPNQNARNPLNSINPSDIESIEVLKDASATAIYGSRGANGVIMITTKKGASGDLKIKYDGYYGTQSVLKKLDILNTAQYIKIVNDISLDMGNDPYFSESDIASIGKGTDWQDEIYRTVPVQSHQISFSGGSGYSNYFISLNHFNQDGILVNSAMERYSGRVNFNHSIPEVLDVGINITSSSVIDENAPYGSGGNELAGLINSALQFDPTLSNKRQENGRYFLNPLIALDNPAAIAAGMRGEVNTNRTLGTFYLTYYLMDDLNIKVNAGSDIQNARRDLFNGFETISGFASSGIANVTSSSSKSQLAELTSTYKTEFSGQKLEVLGGLTYQRFENSYLQNLAQGFPTDVIDVNNLRLGNDELDAVYSGKNTNKLLSYLFRANYTLYDKYLFSASFRADGSSRFGENNKYGYFPSAAVAWKITSESFMEEIDYLNDLKLRISWGETGNQEIGNLNSISTLQLTTGHAWDGSYVAGVSPARIPNPDLKWESTEQTNFGIDFEFLEGRIFGSLDYYNKTTDDMLLNIPIPSSSGFSSVLKNIGSVENSGFEFFISSKNLTGEFSWKTSLNLATLKNEVIDLGGIPEIVTGSLNWGSNYAIIKPGEPLYSFYGYKVEGIFQIGDDIANSAQPGSQPGYPIFRDQNNDGIINADDRVILGDPYPDLTLGITNNFSYKNFELSFFLQAVIGVDLLSNNLIASYYPINFLRNRYSEPYLNRWTPDNPSNKYPSGVNPSLYGGGVVNSLTVQDASFLSLKEVTLRYNIPLTNNILSAVSVYITGQNLFLWTDYLGYNPEASVFGNSNLRIDNNAYPIARTIITGVNISF